MQANHLSQRQMSKYSMALKGNEHAVLLFHGLAATPLEVRYLANALHRQGFSVFAPSCQNTGSILTVIVEPGQNGLTLPAPNF